MTDKIQEFIKKYGADLGKKNIALYSIIKAFDLFIKDEFIECDEYIGIIRKRHGTNITERTFSFPETEVKPTKRPPIGLKPKKIHTAQRFAEVCNAITDYYDAGKKISIEWIEEYNELIDELKS